MTTNSQSQKFDYSIKVSFTTAVGSLLTRSVTVTAHSTAKLVKLIVVVKFPFRTKRKSANTAFHLAEILVKLSNTDFHTI